MKRLVHIFLSLLLSAVAYTAAAQETVVRGRVTDAATHEALPYVSVVFKGTTIGTSTGDDGSYLLKAEGVVHTIQISFVGYKTIEQTIVENKDQTINIALVSTTHSLGEVLVKPKKQHYTNKNNPAVELIDLVVQHRPENRISAHQFAQYNQYEKMSFAFSNTPDKLQKQFFFRSYKFMLQNLDTTSLPGRALLPWYMQERTQDVYYRQDPSRKKTFITGEKKVDYGDLVDDKGLQEYMHHLYQDIDIYEGNINLITNQFLSPIADLAPSFYKYFITDTVKSADGNLVELSFFPRNKASFLFQGKMWVTLDGRYAVQHVDMHLNKDINLNWVKDLHIILDFDKDSTGARLLTKSTLLADFAVSKNSNGGMFGKREIVFSNYKFNQPQPDSLYKGMDVETQSKADSRDTSYWTANRTDTLTQQEAQTYVNVDRLTHTSSFKIRMDLLALLFSGYIQAHVVEFGPTGTFYSFNPVEGFRLRLGGRTTTKFSKKVTLESYGAYGFKDQKWKYYFGGIYSFTPRSIYDFPVVALKVNYQRETKIPGQELQFVQEDNFLLSFKRGVNDKWLYNDIFNTSFIKEYPNHFSYEVGYKHWVQTPAGAIIYSHIEDGLPKLVKNITTSEASLTLHWAPHEEFYQGKKYRTPIINKYPVFTLRTTLGIKGLLGGEYNYQNVSLSMAKHIYASQLGYANLYVEGGYIFGKAPYPLLDIHRANQTYSMQFRSFNMMNFLEFVSDHYISAYMDYCFNGFLFNRVPLLKKLKWREYVNGKILVGGLRNENNPDLHDGLVQFPTNTNGTQATYKLGNTPYFEGSVGVGNILKFFRVDFVKRFTYLDNPNVSSFGIRSRLLVDF